MQLRYKVWVHNLIYSSLCSGITCGRVLNGELYVQRFQKLYAFIYRLSHKDSSSIIRTNTVSVLMIEEKSHV